MDAYTQAGVNAGLSPDLAAYMPRYVQIESGGNASAQTGSYSGLLQMGPSEAQQYGGNGLDAGARMYADKANWFQSKYGRAPTPTELYLANQQGQGGLAAHLSNPDAPAWQNMLSTGEGQRKGPAWAKQAIWGNVPTDVRSQFPGGVDSLTSAQFMDLWQHKVERTPMTAAFADNRTPTSMNPMQSALQQAQPPMQQAMQAPPQQPAGFDLGNLGNSMQRAGAWLMAPNSNGASLGALGSLTPNRKFVPIGTDEFGNPRYGWVDERAGTVTPVSGTGAATSNGSGVADTLGSIRSAQANGASRQDLLKMAPGGYQADLAAMLDYKAVPGNLTRQGPMRNALITYAHSIDPNFDETQLPARVQFNKDLINPNTKIGGQFVKQGTALQTLADLAESSVGLGNSNGVLGLDAAATAQNAARGLTTEQAAKIAAFNLKVGAYTGEKGQLLYPGTGGTHDERAAISAPFSAYGSPSKLADALESELQNERARSDTLQQQIDSNGIKRQVIGPDAQANIDRVNRAIKALRAGQSPASNSATTAPTISGIRQIK